VKTTTKWRRVRPGLYHLYRMTKAGVQFLALVERGAETGQWWWKQGGRSGRASLLASAKAHAEVWL
jgi:cation diffusion facilitator CzcD-associated flavoprotein CzcO